MNPITFDTLKFAKSLQRTGLTAEQAETFATVQREVVNQLAQEQEAAIKSNSEHLATKADIAELRAETKTDLARLEARMETQLAKVVTEMKFVKWTQGIVLTGIVAILVATFVNH